MYFTTKLMTNHSFSLLVLALVEIRLHPHVFLSVFIEVLTHSKANCLLILTMLPSSSV